MILSKWDDELWGEENYLDIDFQPSNQQDALLFLMLTNKELWLWDMSKEGTFSMQREKVQMFLEAEWQFQFLKDVLSLTDIEHAFCKIEDATPLCMAKTKWVKKYA